MPLHFLRRVSFYENVSLHVVDLFIKWAPWGSWTPTACYGLLRGTSQIYTSQESR